MTAHLKMIYAIEQDIRDGHLSFQEIAEKHNVPSYMVTDIFNLVCECELDD